MSASFPFLELPPELRDLIYEYTSLQSGAVLHPQSNGKPISPAPLSLVSRKVHEEYNDVLYASASCLTVYVHDFDFAHLVRFVDEISKRDADEHSTKSLPINCSISHRELEIVLSLTDNCRNRLDELHSWLKRFSSHTSNHYSSTFHTRYSVHSGTGTAGSSSTVAPITLMRVIDEVYWTWYLQTPVGLLKEEIGKACDCLGEAEMRINRLRTGSIPTGPRLGGLENI